MSSDAKYQSNEELEKRIAYLRRRERFLVDRMNRYGPTFWHFKLNGCRLRIRHIEGVLASRETAA